MSKRTSSSITNGSPKESATGERASESQHVQRNNKQFFPRLALQAWWFFIMHIANTPFAGEDKQKKLLQEDSGHFSMIKMLHLADLITELNGSCFLSFSFYSSPPPPATTATAIITIKLQHKLIWILQLGFCGVMSIFASMRYCLGPPSAHGNLWAALAFMPFGLFFDFMDGKVARWRKKSSLMGQELDSLADLVSVPAVHFHLCSSQLRTYIL